VTWAISKMRSLIFLIICLGIVRAQECFVTGQCTNSTLIAVTHPANSRACLADCKNQTECNWFTYNADTELCALLDGCQSLNQECQHCVSGEVTCETAHCNIEGICLVSQSKRRLYSARNAYAWQMQVCQTLHK
jgi:hypothetical protein